MRYIWLVINLTDTKINFRIVRKCNTTISSVYLCDPWIPKLFSATTDVSSFTNVTCFETATATVMTPKARNESFLNASQRFMFLEMFHRARDAKRWELMIDHSDRRIVGYYYYHYYAFMRYTWSIINWRTQRVPCNLHKTRIAQYIIIWLMFA